MEKTKNAFMPISTISFLNKQFGDKLLSEMIQDGPFLETEFIFYEVIDFLFKKRNPDCRDLDYFFKKKTNDFDLQSSAFDILETITSSSFSEQTLAKYLNFSMSGNSHDLSQNTDFYHEKRNEEKELVCDDTLKVASFLMQKESYKSLIIIPDNGSVEFFADLCLAMFLLSTNKFEHIVFKMNERPKFVSDVTKQDYDMIKSFFKRDRLIDYLFDSYEKDGRLKFDYVSDYTQIPYVKDFSASELEELQKADMILVKGDLNFRRFLIDGNIPFDVPLENTLPESLRNQKIVFLRMIKSSLVTGLSENQTQNVNGIIEELQKDAVDNLNPFY